MLAAGKGHRPLLAETVGNFGNVGKLDRTAAAKADLSLAQRISVGRVAQNAHGLARTCDLRLSAGRVDILLTQHGVNLAGADAKGLHLCRVKDNADFAIHAAVAADRSHAFNRE